MDAPHGEQAVGDVPDLLRRAPEGQDLETGVRVEVDVQRGGDRLIAVVLDVGKLVGEGAGVVIVDEGEDADRLAPLLRPFLPDEFVRDLLRLT